MNYKEQLQADTQAAMQADEIFQALLAKAPREQPCREHPDVILQLSPDTFWDEYRRQSEHSREYCSPVYQRCPKCREEEIRRRLANAGVPSVLHECSLDNWTPGNDQEKLHLEAARTFAMKIRRGFLLLLGPVGVGKSHLAVAVQRTFKYSVFVKQSSLLRQLRATYSDKKAADPIERCQETELLVLDEMGVSGGGKDEWPMLSEILDHRYAHLKATVITSNLSWDELRTELGDRLGDRMRESAHSVLVFSGASHRPEHRDKYFTAVPRSAANTSWRNCAI